MAEVLLYHHVQGLTDGVRAFADDLRRDGHTVHTPDLFDGRTFGSLDEGMGFVREAGFDALRERGVAAAEGLGPELVYAGLSFGVTAAQKLAQTRPGARGALLLHACIPVTEYGTPWPGGVPVQIHGKEGDEYFAEDLPAARDLAASASAAELFLYPGDQHLFTDASLGDFDADAYRLLLERVRTFLASV
ncbi:dienelactone hydrolase family protein [Streptomyces sp. NPDC095602]|uniref:dienelactone hydrolase family protein n=1 Tax=Streptomyces sp. NPDC095602 TaxID=3155819 RepID=UPI00331B5CF9